MRKDDKNILSTMKRCAWAEGKDELYTAYHDNEWGVPCYDEHTLIEMLILESFHAGLSWYIILKKRDKFRAAFDNFDVYKIAEYDEIKIEELMQNKGIVRSRLKIEVTINNAKEIIKIKEEYGSFNDYIWHFTDGKIIYNTDNVFHTKTELSDIISKDMKKRGMKFLGSVTVYSYLQAVGIVHDHETTCFKYNLNKD